MLYTKILNYNKVYYLYKNIKTPFQYFEWDRKVLKYLYEPRKLKYRVAQKILYTLWHEKYYSIIVNTVFIQKQNWWEMSLNFGLYYIILHSHPEIEISFKFIPKILMSKECIHFWATRYLNKSHERFNLINYNWI